jgi:hypothetical protein
VDETLALPWGIKSVILTFKIRDLSSNNGAGKTGLAFDTSGIAFSTITDNEAVPVVYSSGASTLEAQAAVGAYVAPTATKARFVAVDGTNNPGVYQLSLADARFAVAGARELNITSLAMADAEQTDIKVLLTGINNMVNGNSGMVVNNTTIATRASQTSFTLTAGSADDDAYNGCILITRDQTTPGQISIGVVLDYTGASKTVTLVGNPGFTSATGDYVTILPPNATTAEIEAALNGATVTLSGSTFIGTMTISIP